MLRNLFNTFDSLETKCEKFRTYMESKDFISDIINSELYVNEVIAFAIEVLTVIQPDKTKNNEYRNLILKVLYKYRMDGVYSRELIHIYNNTIYNDNLDNVMLVFKPLVSLLMSPKVSEQELEEHINALHNLFGYMFVILERGNEYMVEQAFKCIAHIFEYCSNLQLALSRIKKQIYTLIVRSVNLYIKYMNNRSVTDRIKINRKLSLGVIFSISRLMKLIAETNAFASRNELFVNGILELSKFAIFYCPVGANELRKELTYFIFTVVMTSRDIFVVKIEELYDMRFFYTHGLYSCNVKGLLGLTEIQVLHGDKLSKHVYIELLRRTEEVLMSILYVMEDTLENENTFIDRFTCDMGVFFSEDIKTLDYEKSMKFYCECVVEIVGCLYKQLRNLPKSSMQYTEIINYLKKCFVLLFNVTRINDKIIGKVTKIKNQDGSVCHCGKEIEKNKCTAKTCTASTQDPNMSYDHELCDSILMTCKRMFVCIANPYREIYDNIMIIINKNAARTFLSEFETTNLFKLFEMSIKILKVTNIEESEFNVIDNYFSIFFIPIELLVYDLNERYMCAIVALSCKKMVFFKVMMKMLTKVTGRPTCTINYIKLLHKILLYDFMHIFTFNLRNCLQDEASEMELFHSETCDPEALKKLCQPGGRVHDNMVNILSMTRNEEAPDMEKYNDAKINDKITDEDGFTYNSSFEDVLDDDSCAEEDSEETAAITDVDPNVPAGTGSPEKTTKKLVGRIDVSDVIQSFEYYDLNEKKTLMDGGYLDEKYYKVLTVYYRYRKNNKYNFYHLYFTIIMNAYFELPLIASKTESIILAKCVDILIYTQIEDLHEVASMCFKRLHMTKERNQAMQTFFGKRHKAYITRFITLYHKTSNCMYLELLYTIPCNVDCISSCWRLYIDPVIVTTKMGGTLGVKGLKIMLHIIDNLKATTFSVNENDKMCEFLFHLKNKIADPILSSFCTQILVRLKYNQKHFIVHKYVYRDKSFYVGGIYAEEEGKMDMVDNLSRTNGCLENKMNGLTLDSKMQPSKLPLDFVIVEIIQFFRGKFLCNDKEYIKQAYKIVRFKNVEAPGKRSDDLIKNNFDILVNFMYSVIGFAQYKRYNIQEKASALLKKLLKKRSEFVAFIKEVDNSLFMTELTNSSYSDQLKKSQYLYDALLALFACENTVVQDEARAFFLEVIKCCTTYWFVMLLKRQGKEERVYFDKKIVLTAIIESLEKVDSNMPINIFHDFLDNLLEISGSTENFMSIGVIDIIYTEMMKYCTSSNKRKRLSGSNGLCGIIIWEQLDNASFYKHLQGMLRGIRHMVENTDIIHSRCYDAFSIAVKRLNACGDYEHRVVACVSLFQGLVQKNTNVKTYSKKMILRHIDFLREKNVLLMQAKPMMCYLLEFSAIYNVEDFYERVGVFLFLFKNISFVFSQKVLSVLSKFFYIYMLVYDEAKPTVVPLHAKQGIQYFASVDDADARSQNLYFYTDIKDIKTDPDKEKHCKNRTGVTTTVPNTDTESPKQFTENANCMRYVNKRRPYFETNVRKVFYKKYREFERKLLYNAHMLYALYHDVNEVLEIYEGFEITQEERLCEYYKVELSYCYILLTRHANACKDVFHRVFNNLPHGLVAPLKKLHDINPDKCRYYLTKLFNDIVLSPDVTTDVVKRVICILLVVEDFKDDRIIAFIKNVLSETTRKREVVVCSQNPQESVFVKTFELSLMYSDQTGLYDIILLVAYPFLFEFSKSYIKHIEDRLLHYLEKHSGLVYSIIVFNIAETSMLYLARRLYASVISFRNYINNLGVTKAIDTLKFCNINDNTNDSVTVYFENLTFTDTLHIRNAVNLLKFICFVEYQPKPRHIQIILTLYAEMQKQNKNMLDMKKFIKYAINSFSNEHFDYLFAIDPLFRSYNSVKVKTFSHIKKKSIMGSLLESLQRNDTNSFENLVKFFGDHSWMLIDTFVDLKYNSALMKKYCNDCISRHNYNPRVLYYLSTFSPALEYFPMLANVSSNERMYVLRSMKNIVQAFLSKRINGNSGEIQDRNAMTTKNDLNVDKCTQSLLITETILRLLRSDEKQKFNIHVTYPLLICIPALLTRSICDELLLAIYRLFKSSLASHNSIAGNLLWVVYEYCVNNNIEEPLLVDLYTLYIGRSINSSYHLTSLMLDKMPYKVKIDSLDVTSLDPYNVIFLLQRELNNEMISGVGVTTQGTEASRSVSANFINVVGNCTTDSTKYLRMLVLRLIPNVKRPWYTAPVSYDLLHLLIDYINIDEYKEYHETTFYNVVKYYIANGFIWKVRKNIFEFYSYEITDDNKDANFNNHRNTKRRLAEILDIMLQYKVHQDHLLYLVSKIVINYSTKHYDIGGQIEKFLLSATLSINDSILISVSIFSKMKKGYYVVSRDLLLNYVLMFLNNNRNIRLATIEKISEIFYYGLTYEDRKIRSKYFYIFDDILPKSYACRLVSLMSLDWSLCTEEYIPYILVRMMLCLYNDLQLSTFKLMHVGIYRSSSILLKSSISHKLKYNEQMYHRYVHKYVRYHDAAIDKFRPRNFTSKLYMFLYDSYDCCITMLDHLLSKVCLSEESTCDSVCCDDSKKHEDGAMKVGHICGNDTKNKLHKVYAGMEFILSHTKNKKDLSLVFVKFLTRQKSISIKNLCKLRYGSEAWFYIDETLTGYDKIFSCKDMLLKDYYYGSLRAYSKLPETSRGSLFHQLGLIKEAQQTYEEIFDKALKSQLSYYEDEYNTVLDEWHGCAKELQQWDVLHKLHSDKINDNKDKVHSENNNDKKSVSANLKGDNDKEDSTECMEKIEEMARRKIINRKADIYLEMIFCSSNFSTKKERDNFIEIVRRHKHECDIVMCEFYEVFIELYDAFPLKKAIYLIKMINNRLSNGPDTKDYNTRHIILLQIMFEMHEVSFVFSGVYENVDKLRSISHKWQDRRPRFENDYSTLCLFSAWKMHMYRKLDDFANELNFSNIHINESYDSFDINDIGCILSRNKTKTEGIKKVKKLLYNISSNGIVSAKCYLALASYKRAYYNNAIYWARDASNVPSCSCPDVYYCVILDLMCYYQTQEYRLGLENNKNYSTTSEEYKSCISRIRGMLYEKSGNIKEAKRCYFQAINMDEYGDNYYRYIKLLCSMCEIYKRESMDIFDIDLLQRDVNPTITKMSDNETNDREANADDAPCSGNKECPSSTDDQNGHANGVDIFSDDIQSSSLLAPNTPQYGSVAKETELSCEIFFSALHGMNCSNVDIARDLFLIVLVYLERVNVTVDMDLFDYLVDHTNVNAYVIFIPSLVQLLTKCNYKYVTVILQKVGVVYPHVVSSSLHAFIEKMCKIENQFYANLGNKVCERFSTVYKAVSMTIDKLAYLLEISCLRRKHCTLELVDDLILDITNSPYEHKKIKPKLTKLFKSSLMSDSKYNLLPFAKHLNNNRLCPFEVLDVLVKVKKSLSLLIPEIKNYNSAISVATISELNRGMNVRRYLFGSYSIIRNDYRNLVCLEEFDTRQYEDTGFNISDGIFVIGSDGMLYKYEYYRTTSNLIISNPELNAAIIKEINDGNEETREACNVGSAGRDKPVMSSVSDEEEEIQKISVPDEDTTSQDAEYEQVYYKEFGVVTSDHGRTGVNYNAIECVKCKGVCLCAHNVGGKDAETPTPCNETLSMVKNHMDENIVWEEIDQKKTKTCDMGFLYNFIGHKIEKSFEVNSSGGFLPPFRYERILDGRYITLIQYDYTRIEHILQIDISRKHKSNIFVEYMEYFKQMTQGTHEFVESSGEEENETHSIITRFEKQNTIVLFNAFDRTGISEDDIEHLLSNAFVICDHKLIATNETKSEAFLRILDRHTQKTILKEYMKEQEIIPSKYFYAKNTFLATYSLYMMISYLFNTMDMQPDHVSIENKTGAFMHRKLFAQKLDGLNFDKHSELYVSPNVQHLFGLDGLEGPFLSLLFHSCKSVVFNDYFVDLMKCYMSRVHDIDVDVYTKSIVDRATDITRIKDGDFQIVKIINRWTDIKNIVKNKPGEVAWI